MSRFGIVAIQAKFPFFDEAFRCHVFDTVNKPTGFYVADRIHCADGGDIFLKLMLCLNLFLFRI